MDSEDSLGFGFAPEHQTPNNVINPTPGVQPGLPQQQVNNMNTPYNGQVANQQVLATAGQQPAPETIGEDEAKSKCRTCMHNVTSSDWWGKFFDVDIKQFGKRCGYVFYFWSKKFYSNMGTYGDLWGPIWIPISLIIILAACAVVGNTFGNQLYHMSYLIGYTIGLVFYQILIPVVLYFIIRCGSERYIIRMTQLFCIYGYSQIVYIPIGILLLLPSQINGSAEAMITIVCIAWGVLTIFSVLFVSFTLFGTLKKVFFKKTYWIITIVFGLLHAGMAVGTLLCVMLNGRI